MTKPDLQAGKALKDAGLASIEARNPDVLGALRNLAKNLAWERGEISVNDLREESQLPEDTTPLVFSAVFRGKEWEPCGYTQATHPAAHARTVRVYRFRRKEW